MTITENTRVRIENRGDGWDGTTARVDRVTGEGEPYEAGYFLEADNGLNPFGTIDIGHWTAQYLTVIDGPAKVGRPTIDFSTPSRQTARNYAAVLQTKVIDEKHNKTLQRVQFGAEDVDALALNEALLAAMRSGATRFGQSMVRREFTSKVAHLGYIVQAVLENHANLLPPYEGGPRSPRIASLEASLEEAKVVERDLLAEVTEVKAQRDHVREGLQYAEKLWANERGSLTQAASDERRRLCSEIDALRAGVNEATAEISELTNVLEASRKIGEVRDKLVDDVAAERNTLGAVLAYVFERADEVFQAEITGYWNGLLDGTGQERN